ncbi:MAG: hypothetical protein K0Q74_718 [Gammaproteobacteria bacterium]|nr:hypothetical protein [Gammaproteobacteria bacterium]
MQEASQVAQSASLTRNHALIAAKIAQDGTEAGAGETQSATIGAEYISQSAKDLGALTMALENDTGPIEKQIAKTKRAIEHTSATTQRVFSNTLARAIQAADQAANYADGIVARSNLPDDLKDSIKHASEVAKAAAELGRITTHSHTASDTASIDIITNTIANMRSIAADVQKAERNAYIELLNRKIQDLKQLINDANRAADYHINLTDEAKAADKVAKRAQGILDKVIGNMSKFKDSDIQKIFGAIDAVIKMSKKAEKAIASVYKHSTAVKKADIAITEAEHTAARANVIASAAQNIGDNFQTYAEQARVLSKSLIQSARELKGYRDGLQSAIEEAASAIDDVKETPNDAAAIARAMGPVERLNGHIFDRTEMNTKNTLWEIAQANEALNNLLTEISTDRPEFCLNSDLQRLQQELREITAANNKNKEAPVTPTSSKPKKRSAKTKSEGNVEEALALSTPGSTPEDSNASSDITTTSEGGSEVAMEEASADELVEPE